MSEGRTSLMEAVCVVDGYAGNLVREVNQYEQKRGRVWLLCAIVPDKQHRTYRLAIPTDPPRYYNACDGHRSRCSAVSYFGPNSQRTILGLTSEKGHEGSTVYNAPRHDARLLFLINQRDTAPVFLSA